MVVGHTKFGPDDLARAIAGVYQRNNSLNSEFSCLMFILFAAEWLTTGGENTTEALFGKVDAVRSYPVFIMIGDDGKVEMGLPEASYSATPMPSSGPMYKLSKLKSEICQLKEISLVPVMMDVFNSSFRGIGSGSGMYGPPPEFLLPQNVSSIRTPSLFCAVNETDEFLVEQVGWFKFTSVSPAQELQKVNDALGELKTYDAQGGMQKEPYGGTKDQMVKSYGFYVPHVRVPLQYDILTGQSKFMSKLVLSRTSNGGVSTTSTAAISSSTSAGASCSNQAGPTLSNARTMLTSARYKRSRD